MTTWTPPVCRTTGNPGSAVHPACSIEIADDDSGDCAFTEGTGPCSVHTGWSAAEVLAEGQAWGLAQETYINELVEYLDDNRNPVVYHP